MIPFQLVKTANEVLMHFRSNKKNGNTISLNDSVGYDKDGNEVSLLEVKIGRAHV